MQDRVSLYPGRVKLIPVTGQENTYDMVRADEPTQEGTPLNTENLLKVATAALYGLPNTAVPDEVFALLKPIVYDTKAAVDKCGNCQLYFVTYTGTGTYGASNPCSLTFPKLPYLFLIQAPDGGILLALRGAENYQKLSSGSSAYFTGRLAWTGTTVSWYTSSSYAHVQMNESGKLYRVLALLPADE